MSLKNDDIEIGQSHSIIHHIAYINYNNRRIFQYFGCLKQFSAILKILHVHSVLTKIYFFIVLVLSEGSIKCWDTMISVRQRRYWVSQIYRKFTANIYSNMRIMVFRPERNLDLDNTLQKITGYGWFAQMDLVIWHYTRIQILNRIRNQNQIRNQKRSQRRVRNLNWIRNQNRFQNSNRFRYLNQTRNLTPIYRVTL